MHDKYQRRGDDAPSLAADVIRHKEGADAEGALPGGSRGAFVGGAGERWEQEGVHDELKTHLVDRTPAPVVRRAG